MVEDSSEKLALEDSQSAELCSFFIVLLPATRVFAPTGPGAIDLWGGGFIQSMASGN
jgi:hypothetical protein